MIQIRLDKEQTHKIAVSVRNMSKTHWKALRKLALIEDKSLAEYIAQLVEEKINGDTSNQ